MTDSEVSRSTMSTFINSQAEVWAQLDQPWDQARLVVLDFETTGLSSRDAIISYGAVHIDAGRVVGRSSVYGLVRPDVALTPDSIRVHAIREQDLAQAPALPEALDPLFASMVGRVLVAHTAWVETGFLDRAMLARGLSVDLTVIDTAELAWSHFGLPRDPHRSPGLETVASRLGLPVFSPHYALGDAWTTAVILLAMARHRAQDQTLTLRDLVTASHPDKHRRFGVVRHPRKSRRQ
ncbi:MAG: exonuclease domain-containing protein [Propionibacteriaceae bacterium]|nr:exonuclease domain-containing protein [Propionibacteriaceae bacterium]